MRNKVQVCFAMMAINGIKKSSLKIKTAFEIEHNIFVSVSIQLMRSEIQFPDLY
jgi:hypothetical protein